MMDQNDYSNEAEMRRMIEKYIAGKANSEEKAFLEAYFETFEGEAALTEQLNSVEKKELGDKMRESILNSMDAPRVPVRRMVFRRIAVAAIFIGVVLSTGLYFYFRDKKTNNPIASAPASSQVNDIDPGGNKAILTLPDGRKIDLDDASIGEISRQNGSVIQKTQDGQLVYDLSKTDNNSTAAGVNSIQTPIGGEYQVVLSDGTKVWLNSNSSFEFPTAFNGNERQVKLKGEGYFEVAKNPSKPFKVQVNDMKVQVLGTHFNIMAYDDEAKLKTTLLEGSVNIVKGGKAKILKPGQQASIAANETDIDVANVDTEDAVAWKNGYFKFSQDDIKTVMRRFSRWYEMEVVYDGPVPVDQFSGKIRRNIKASKALQFLEQTGLHFRIEGKKVIIQAK